MMKISDIEIVRLAHACAVGVPKSMVRAMHVAIEYEKQIHRLETFVGRKATAAEAQQAKENLLNASAEAAKYGHMGVMVSLSDVAAMFIHEKPIPWWKFWRRR